MQYPAAENIIHIKTPPASLSYTQGVHIWLISLQEHKDIFDADHGYFQHCGHWHRAEKSFSEAEYKQLQGTTHPQKAALYATGHLMLRHALRKAIPSMPFTQAFATEDKGKPYIPPRYNAENIHFSLSSAWPFVAVALSAGMPCGVDIERPVVRVDWEIGAEKCLQPEEIRAIHTASHPPCAYARIWTRKEAASKAVGLGLHWDFASFSVDESSNTVFCPQKQLWLWVRSVCLADFYPGLQGWLSLAHPCEHPCAHPIPSTSPPPLAPPIYIHTYSPAQ